MSRRDSRLDLFRRGEVLSEGRINEAETRLIEAAGRKGAWSLSIGVHSLLDVATGLRFRQHSCHLSVDNFTLV